jgi:hypothetical protein
MKMDDIRHLDRGPRDLEHSLCGQPGEVTCEINEVTCERCAALHDEITKED